jgi:hypothetical protein
VTIASTRWQSARIDAVFALSIFLAAWWWGTTYWNQSLANGREPQFYQEYFEPAVMVACHRGFSITHPTPPKLVDFLSRRSDRFDCNEIPESAAVNTDGLYQGAWRYMLATVGFAWRWLGISWSGLGPLCGLFFGVTMVIAFGICRLGMGRFVAMAMTIALALSTLHLTNLPNFRDYAKVPFTLALVLLLGLLVRPRPKSHAVIGISALYGVTLGVGYGFRSDLLIDLPPVFVTLWLFLEGGILDRLQVKLAATVVCALAFLISAWPIYSYAYANGGSESHVALLGLSRPFDRPLHVVHGPYDFGYVYEDEYVFEAVESYAARLHPDWVSDRIASHQYYVASSAYLLEVITRFPSDLLTRAYSSALQLPGIGFERLQPPMPSFWPRLYTLRSRILAPLRGTGPLLEVAVMLGVSALSVRVAFFLLFLFVYFGGYPAVQFADRHYFHLELMTWWAVGAIVAMVFHWPARLLHQWRTKDVWSWAIAPARNIAVFVAASLAMLVVPLVALRVYQSNQARQLFRTYVDAPKQPISIMPDANGFAAVRASDSRRIRLLEVDIKNAMCAGRPKMTLQYDKEDPVFDYSRTLDDVLRASTGTTRIFAAIYPQTFQGLLFHDIGGCLGDIGWVELDRTPLMLNTVLAPGWEHGVLYQRLALERFLQSDADSVTSFN